MRPDQHKKKRSSDYKKKRGITTDKNKKPSVDNTSKLSDDEFSDNDHGRFKRKQIESNWERYRDISDNEDDQGEDYSVLVSRGGDASNHIKLLGEEEWDDQSQSAAFNIDYNKLATQLSKLPFVKRFGLDRLQVNTDIISHLQDNEDSIIKTAEEQAFASHLISKEESSDLGFSFSTDKTKTHETQPLAQLPQPDSKLGTHISTSPSNDENPIQSIDRASENVSQDDRVLDDLLQTATNPNDRKASEHISPLPKSEYIAVQASQEVDNDSPNEEVDDLEDWLDSII